MHFNPVKHGLVHRVIDWPYSTFHRLVDQGVYSHDWAGAPMPRPWHMMNDMRCNTLRYCALRGLNVNQELIKTDNCGVYRKYAKDKFLFVLESDARKERRGLWGLPQKRTESALGMEE